MLNASYLLYYLILGFFVWQRTRIFMHFFQQEEYNNCRFINYLFQHYNLLDKKLTITLIILTFINYITNNITIHLNIITVTLAIFSLLASNLPKNTKKPLVITSRVTRLFIIIAGIFISLLLLTNNLTITIKWQPYLSTIFLVQAIPLLIVVANFLLLPIEKLIQINYLQSAKKTLTQYQPTIIAITGSYGKTSTKHILAHILSSVAPTLATPGSINTPMGITKVIREKLQAEHKFFLVEMGAYGKGSITRLCNLSPPTYGIITTIGSAHFERFKTVANIAQTKFELAKAIANQKHGLLLVNSKTIEPQFIQQYGNSQTIDIATASNTNGPTYLAHDIQQTINGLNFELSIAKQSYPITTNLYGLQHVDNITLCFALAHKLGLSPETIIAALKTIPQIPHRLEVIKEPAKPIIIDDAYNSNPSGFLAALAVLAVFKQHGYKSILVTPGMIELGELHEAKHFELGVKAAAIADYVLVILPERIPSFIAGFQQYATKAQKLLTFNTFAAAKAWLNIHATINEVILLENDLPDLYESTIRF